MCPPERSVQLTDPTKSWVDLISDPNACPLTMMEVEVYKDAFKLKWADVRKRIGPNDIVTPQGPMRDDAVVAYVAQQAPLETLKALYTTGVTDAEWIAAINSYMAKCGKDGKLTIVKADNGVIWVINPMDPRIATSSA